MVVLLIPTPGLGFKGLGSKDWGLESGFRMLGLRISVPKMERMHKHPGYRRRRPMARTGC